MQSLKSVFEQKEKPKKESSKEKKQKEKYQLISTGINKYIPTDISTDTKYDNDILFEDLQDLVSVRFKAWYCKRFYELGKDNVLRMASVARADGKEPKKLFSYLLKNGL